LARFDQDINDHAAAAASISAGNAINHAPALNQ